MRDAHSVITEAVNGHTKELAQEYEVSLPRMYQILSDDCPYPKTKLLIRKIGRVNKEGVRLIKADMKALFDDVLGKDDHISIETLNREAFEAVQAGLENKPVAEQQKELRELIAAASARLREVSNERRETAKQKTLLKFQTNGRG